VTPFKIPTVEQIIQTLPQNASAHASDAATPHTDVSDYKIVQISFFSLFFFTKLSVLLRFLFVTDDVNGSDRTVGSLCGCLNNMTFDLDV